MRTEAPADASDAPLESPLAHAPDPSTPGIVTVYNPQADGESLAAQWLTVDEDTLYDLSDWR
ncbi:DUF7511 domain-containing protein [Halomarina oriensis]|uniref:DUF7511 domain-containing protein n=1 Tax=Halomarina oriensis TaxID=671145 RepID=A0A6B0GHD7_9EURY|nr:hypothetical protein [Halomarina oriensis]MWG33181.1 hypothetical protein [Halomarina oriensis]